MENSKKKNCHGGSFFFFFFFKQALTNSSRDGERNHFRVWRQPRAKQVSRKTRRSHLCTAAAGRAWWSLCQRWTPLGCTPSCFGQTRSQSFGVSPFVFRSGSHAVAHLCAPQNNLFFFSASSWLLYSDNLTRWRTRTAHSHDLTVSSRQTQQLLVKQQLLKTVSLAHSSRLLISFDILLVLGCIPILV